MKEELVYEGHGIRIVGQELPTYANYCKWYDKVNGVGFWGQLWAQRIRPRLFPHLHKLYETCLSLAKCVHGIEFGEAKISALDARIEFGNAKIAVLKAHLKAHIERLKKDD